MCIRDSPCRSAISDQTISSGSSTAIRRAIIVLGPAKTASCAVTSSIARAGAPRANISNFPLQIGGRGQCQLSTSLAVQRQAFKLSALSLSPDLSLSLSSAPPRSRSPSSGRHARRAGSLETTARLNGCPHSASPSDSDFLRFSGAASSPVMSFAFNPRR